MGYTHYWKLKAEYNNFYDDAIKDILKIVENHKDILEFEKTEEYISFNGKNESCENMVFYFDIKRRKTNYSKPDNDGFYFNFVKTRRREYDKIVTACLTVLFNYMGEECPISSDGYREDWEEGLKIAEKVLEDSFVNPIGRVYGDEDKESFNPLKELNSKKNRRNFIKVLNEG